jgi:hypothetical protein
MYTTLGLTLSTTPAIDGSDVSGLYTGVGWSSTVWVGVGVGVVLAGEVQAIEVASRTSTQSEIGKQGILFI